MAAAPDNRIGLLATDRIIPLPFRSRLAAAYYFTDVGTVCRTEAVGADGGVVLDIFIVKVSQNLFNLLNGFRGVVQADMIVFLGILYGFGRQPLGELPRRLKLPGFLVLGAKIEA